MGKKLFLFSILSVLCLIFVGIANASTNMSAVLIGDTYVRGGTNAVRNFGSCGNIYLLSSNAVIMYFVWNFTGIPSGKVILNAELTLENEAGACVNCRDVSVYHSYGYINEGTLCSATASGDMLTWNNQPSYNTTAEYKRGINETDINTWNVTKMVSTEYALGNKTITTRLATTSGSCYIKSKEGYGTTSYLTITYADPPILPPSKPVIYSPSNNSYVKNPVNISINSTGSGNISFYYFIDDILNQTNSSSNIFLTLSEGVHNVSVVAFNEQGNSSVSNYAFFNVVFAPAISNVIATPINNSVIINWTTNIESNSTVNTGLDENNFDVSESNSSLVKYHSVKINNLLDARKYYYNVTSCNDGYCNSTGVFNYIINRDYPKASMFSSNASGLQDESVKFNLKWVSKVNLSGYIFSYDNCTGSYVNNSFEQFQNGDLEDWSNVSVSNVCPNGGLFKWKIYANDTYDSWNVSNEYILNYSGISDSIFPNVEVIVAGNENEDPYMGTTNHYQYMNGTWQEEDWIHIVLNIRDNIQVKDMMLRWKDEVGWTDYPLIRINDYYYGVNITNQPRYDKYTFIVSVNDTANNNYIYNWTYYYWNDNYLNKDKYRKYIGLNSNPQPFEYEQMYMSYIGDNYATSWNSVTHEQVNGGGGDMGALSYLRSLTDEETVCAGIINFYINPTLEVSSINISNVYVHFWWASGLEGTNVSGTSARLFYAEQRAIIPDTPIEIEDYIVSVNNRKGNVTFDYGRFNYWTNYSLEARLWDIMDYPLSDNDINFFALYFDQNGIGNTYPSIISTSQYPSFVIFNLPDNATLQGMDTDSDNLTDYDELFVYYSDPRLNDTDSGGMSDYDEALYNRDLNSPLDDSLPLNSPPEITYIESISPVNLNSGTYTTIEIKFSIYDSNGRDDINTSSISCVSIGTNESIILTNITNGYNVTCKKDLYYWYQPSINSVNLSISDLSNVIQSNLTSFTINQLDSIQLNTSSISYGNLLRGSNDNSGSTIKINNFGNTDYLKFSIKGYDLVGITTPSYYISAENIEFITSDNVNSGQSMFNNTEIDILNSGLPKGEGSNITLYNFLDVPLIISAQTYRSNYNWIITSFE